MTEQQKKMSRRQLIKTMGAGLAALPALHLLACQDDSGMSAEDMGGSGGGEDLGSSELDMGRDAGQDQGEEQDQGNASDMANIAWATGGTAAMVAAANYPDPFESDAPTTCTLTCGATIGPCHTTSPEQQDVSDGWDGLPVRLSLRVLDEECQPLEDVIVEIWHTNHEGIYSGNITDMCNDVEAYKSQLFFRGYQRTDGAGVVNFDTCYPGWYSGRVVHIHFRIMTGAYNAADNATAEVISQLFFSDELNAEIFGGHEDYSSFGQPDTQLGNDNVVGGEDDPSPYVLDIQKMSDGAMLASKTIILQSSSADSCTMQGAAGGGPGGGGPGGPGGLSGW